MLSRSAITATGALAGFALACLAVVSRGAPGSAIGQLDALQARLAALRPDRAAAIAATAPSTSALLAKPLFGQSQTATVRLDGVSMLPGRKAALVSINGKPADWLALGQTRDGVTLVQVQSGLATIESDAGSKDIRLGDVPPAASTAPVANTVSAPSFLRPPTGPSTVPRAPFAASLPPPDHNPVAGR